MGDANLENSANNSLLLLLAGLGKLTSSCLYCPHGSLILIAPVFHTGDLISWGDFFVRGRSV